MSSKIAVPKPFRQPLNLPFPGQGDILEEGAKREGALMWYTSLIVNQAVRPIVDGFNKRYPYIKVDHYRADSTDLIQRFSNEYQARRYEFDLVDGITGPVLLKAAGALEKYDSPSLAPYPKDILDPDGYWYATNLYFMTEAVKPEFSKFASCWVNVASSWSFGLRLRVRASRKEAGRSPDKLKLFLAPRSAFAAAAAPLAASTMTGNRPNFSICISAAERSTTSSVPSTTSPLRLRTGHAGCPGEGVPARSWPEFLRRLSPQFGQEPSGGAPRSVKARTPWCGCSSTADASGSPASLPAASRPGARTRSASTSPPSGTRSSATISMGEVLRQRRRCCRRPHVRHWNPLPGRRCMLILWASDIPWVATFWSSGRNCRTIYYVYTRASVQVADPGGESCRVSRG